MPNLVGEFQNRAKGVEEKRTSFTETLQDTSAKMQENNNAFMSFIQGQQEHAAEVMDNSSAVLERWTEVQANPRIFNRVMSLFDPENYDEQAFKNQLAQSDIELQKVQTRMRTASTVHSLKQSQIEQVRQDVASVYTSDLQGLNNLETTIRLGWAGEEQADRRSKRALESASAEQLREWQTNPEAAPTGLRGKPGLIRAGLIAKRADELGLTSAELGVMAQELQVSEASFSQRSREAFRDTETADLQAIAKGSRTHEVITPQTAKDELARRSERDLSIQAMAQSNKAGKLQLADAFKQRAFASFNVEEFDEFIKDAQDGRTTIDYEGEEVTFSLRELQAGRAAAETAQREREATAIDRLLSTADIQARSEEAVRKIRNLAQVLNPGVSIDPNAPELSLPPDIAGDIQASQSRIDVLTQLAVPANGQPGAGSEAASAKISDELNKITTTIEEFQTNMLKNLPEPERDATRQMLERSRVDSDDAAGRFLTSALKNPGVMVYNPVLDPAWRSMSSALENVEGSFAESGQSLSISPEGGVSIGGGKRPDDVENLRKAVKQSEAQNIAANGLFMRAMQETIANLQGASTDPEKSIWAGLMNTENGQFTDEVYDITASGTKKFNPTKFATLLAGRENALKQAGKLEPDQSLFSMVTAYMAEPTNYRAIAGMLQPEDTAEASMYRILFANDYMRAVSSRIAAFESQAPAAVEQARILKDQLTQVQQQHEFEQQAPVPATSGGFGNMGSAIADSLQRNRMMAPTLTPKQTTTPRVPEPLVLPPFERRFMQEFNVQETE